MTKTELKTALRHHEREAAKLRKALGEKPKRKKAVKNPSPGEREHGPHASADQRKSAALALKAARAWFGNAELVTPPKALKTYKAPTAAVEIGEIVAIEYLSDKYDGTPKVYRHETERRRKLLVSVDGGTFIVCPNFRITKRGIEG